MSRAADEQRGLHALASALGVTEEPSRPLVDTIREHVHGKKLLLIIDNCEHLTGPCGQFASELLAATDHVEVIVTSREPLGVLAESVVSVPPLAVPDRGEDLAPERAPEIDALRLFILRARDRQPGFRFTAENTPILAEVCRRLDGVPLAIELAAAAIPEQSPREIAAWLEPRSGFGPTRETGFS